MKHQKKKHGVHWMGIASVFSLLLDMRLKFLFRSAALKYVQVKLFNIIFFYKCCRSLISVA